MLDDAQVSVLPAKSSELFRCQVAPEDDVLRICLVGELDMNSVSRLDPDLTEARASGWRQFVVDLSRLTFMDSSGVHLMLRWNAGANADGGYTLAIIPGPPVVQRVFELAGVTELLPFVRHGGSRA